MITIKILNNQVDEAERLYPFKNLNGSIKQGKSNIYGAIGEVVVRDYFKKYVNSVESTYDYDLIVKGFKVDVKTKRTTVKPQPHYFCSISAFNTRQKCDYYFFVRVLDDFTEAYLLGYISKNSFFDKAIFKRKGEYDTNGFIFKDDCYNLPILELKPFKENFG